MSQQSEGISLVHLICLSLYMGDEVDFLRFGKQGKRNAIKKEIEQGSGLHPQ